MAQVMWMGTRGNETWVKAPASSADFSRKKLPTQLSFVNGGSAVLGSRTSHAEYNMSWPVAGRLEMRPVLDFAAGIYDNDPLAKFVVPENLVYFIDPMEMDLNLAPINWGNPVLACSDAPSLLNDVRSGVAAPRPEAVRTSANTMRYPTFSARYTLTDTSVPRSFYLPIPPGHTLWAGFHGSATGDAGVKVSPVGSAGRYLTPLGLTGQRVKESFQGATGVDIQLDGSPGDTLTLSALILQIVRSDRAPQGGEYISGRGHSGCAFADEPTVTALSSVNERAEVSVAAKLVEVGAWLKL
ncbi:hypothetical protein [Leifsonia aquatica]|uniref:hypothetical protein n=1 Tax=Leifsonia aquatica TaxID=144185 RepID=UPI00046A073A|nr:hypothetical protein [Leifsonia aquatica]